MFIGRFDLALRSEATAYERCVCSGGLTGYLGGYVSVAPCMCTL